MSNPDDPRTWIVKAESDLLCIGNNIDQAHVPWDAVCFHAQQAVEKLLKALLVSTGREAPRTHDLPALLTYCIECGFAVESLEPVCRLLNPYSVLARYPGAPDPTPEDGHAAAAAAEQVRQRVRDLLRM